MSNLLSLKRANGEVLRFGQMAAVYAVAWIVLGISSAQAGVLMDSGSVLNAGSQDSVFGLLTARDDITGFPQANVLNTTGFSQSTVDYVFTQLGGVTTMAWSASGYQDGSNRAFSATDSDLYFTPTTNQSFTWTSTWDAQSSISAGYFAYLFDITFKGLDSAVNGANEPRLE